MANTKISQLTANTNPTWNEELVYAYNNANGKITLNTMKTYSNTWQQAQLVSWVNIKTINNTSILWSWNIDVSWWGGGSWSPTVLSGNANIWELSEWVYSTEYQLYYKTWERVPTISDWASRSRMQMLFVNEDDSWAKWFFVFNASDLSWTKSARASFWYSYSSSEWTCYSLGSWDESLKHYGIQIWSTLNHPEPLSSDTLSQILTNIDDDSSNEITIDSQYPPYKWATYTILVDSVSSGKTYSITLWTWVTNPLNITLPTNSNKKCVITFLITSSTTAVVTWCTIAS